MPDRPRRHRTDSRPRAGRAVGWAIVFVAVLAAAGLLGRLGSGIEDGPAPTGQPSVSESAGRAAG